MNGEVGGRWRTSFSHGACTVGRGRVQDCVVGEGLTAPRARVCGR